MISETELKTNTQTALEIASRTVVLCDEDYTSAANARKEIKDVSNKIKAYWTPKKDQAYQLHKSLVAAEKEMLKPLEDADKQIDARMGEYRREVERKRQEAERERRRVEEEARRAAEEAQRLLDEASQKDELDDDDVEILRMAQAEVERTQVVEPVYIPQAVKVDGISVRKVWKARIINDALVPISIAGVMLRPVDQSALNKLAVASKGGFACPGVEFYQEENTQVRLR